jgi:hypothetical protein
MISGWAVDGKQFPETSKKILRISRTKRSEALCAVRANFLILNNG